MEDGIDGSENLQSGRAVNYKITTLPCQEVQDCRTHQ